jgi:hypothetical protein
MGFQSCLKKRGFCPGGGKLDVESSKEVWRKLDLLLALYHHVRFFRFSFYTTKKMAPDSVLLLRRHRGRPIKEIYGDNHVP